MDKGENMNLNEEAEQYRKTLIKREQMRKISTTADYKKRMAEHDALIQRIEGYSEQEMINLLAADYR